MTETTSATWRTIARSCEISNRLSESRRERSTSRFADLGLRGRIEGCERLVEDEHGRIRGQRAGDGDSLPLPAAELVRIAGGGARREADEIE